MGIVVPPLVWNLVAVAAQTAFTRALLLMERGATEDEIQEHINDMEAQNKSENIELERLRAENP